MPTYKTLIQKAGDLDNRYPASKKNNIKTQVKTKGELYHSKMNMAHEQFYDKKSAADASNFALAHIVFIIQTPKKRVPISFALSTDEFVFNYQNLDDPEKFKTFCQTAQENSIKVLSNENLKLSGQAGNMDYYQAAAGYYPQIAFHTEKFFFYYLKTEGLKKIIDLFPTKSIKKKNLVSIDAMEIRMHSTRDMCRTCESITISEKDELIKKLNTLMKQEKYPKLPKTFHCEFLMSYNDAKHRKDKTEDNLVGIKSQHFKRPQLSKKDQASLLYTDEYTYFTSGGSSDANKAVNERTAHLKNANQVTTRAKKATQAITTKAAIQIQSFFRGYKARKNFITLKEEQKKLKQEQKPQPKKSRNKKIPI